MQTALVTGASRGLGYEYTRQLLDRGWQVIATVRNADSVNIRALADTAGERLKVRILDVVDHAGIDALADEFRDTPIDLLINNAGTTGPEGVPGCMAYQGLGNMDYAIWRHIHEVNVIAPFKIATAFHEHLAAGRAGLLVNLSSDLGSCVQNTQGNLYPYRMSKAAVNMMSKGMSIEWPDIVCIAMAPGWCQTELGGEDAQIPADESVAAQLDTFAGLTQADSGRLIDRFGNDVPY